MDETVNRTKPALAPGEVAQVKPRRRRRWGRTLVLLIVVAFAGYVVFERIHNAPRSGGRGFGAPPQSVRTAPAATGDMPLTIDALGAVASLATVSVQTQIAGQLQQIGFKEGQTVKVGDFLAQIDPRPYQVTLEQARASLAKDTAALAQARSDLARYETLNRQDSISRQQVEDQQFLVRQNQAATANDQSQIDSAQLNLSYCRIVAPIAGRVGLRQVDPGNYLLSSSATPIVVIAQLEPISVLFSIPEDSLPQIQARLKTGAKLPVIAFDRSNTKQLATGVLDTTDNQIDTTTGTVKVRATFQNSDESLFPNQFVNVRVLVDTVKGATLVPNPAIQRGAPGTFVYLVNSNATVSVAKVQIGPSDQSNTVVSSGLSAGQNVVIDGSDHLSEGAKVVVRNSDAQPAVAAPPRTRSRRGQGGRGGSAGSGAQ